MILVLLGTQINSFDRLLSELDKCIQKGIIKDEVVVQSGHTSYSSNNMKCIDFISSDKLNSLVEKADFIITHGGVGSIVSAVKLNKKVIAVPRLKKYNEHVNDHQLQIIQSFNNNKYIIGLNDVSELEHALNQIRSFKPEKFVSNTKNLLNIVSNYIDSN